jgi:hypothetical protein
MKIADNIAARTDVLCHGPRARRCLRTSKTFAVAVTMLQQIKLHTFKHDDEWESVDSYWGSPFYFWERSGVRLEPPGPVRVRVVGKVIRESSDGRTELGGASSMLIQIVEARGRKGETIRVSIGEPLAVDAADE